ncbi:MAG: hypothetical protein Q8K37_08245, partial [Alphaproteobacteria bacterium]|nr:hypothetical protein [Alphaproteobacteria bacterium]
SYAVLIISNVYANPKCEELWNQQVTLDKTVESHHKEFLNNIMEQSVDAKFIDYKNAQNNHSEQLKPLHEEIKKEGCEKYFNEKVLPKLLDLRKENEELLKKRPLSDRFKKTLTESLSRINAQISFINQEIK